MEKNIGEQLNRAYEAYRQACMDKEQAEKKMKQKVALYEHQICEQNKQIANLKGCVSWLTSQLSSSTGSGKVGVHGPPQSPKPESSDSRRNDTAPALSYEQLQEQLKVTMQREKHYKEQLENERIKSIKLEEQNKTLESVVYGKNEEIWFLKSQIKDFNERRENQDYKPASAHEMEVKSKTLPESTAAVSSFDENTRQGVERIFCDLKEEFSQICKLTRKQSIQLNTFFAKKENAAAEAPVQISMPIQCTDEANEEAQKPTVDKEKCTVKNFASIMPRGLGTDDEVSVSVESLSNLSVKFPPTDNDCEFLESSPEKLPVVNPVSKQIKHLNVLNPDATTLPKNFSQVQCGSPDSQCSAGAACNLDNFKHPDIENKYGSCILESEDDTSLFLAANSPIRKYPDNYGVQDIPDVIKTAESSGQTVRGPQQPIWKPFLHQENDLSLPACEKWDLNSSDICEFCQAIFPPSSRSGGDFLRHLNSHFYGQS
ncbi:TRAF family member-associated NF-kappa-B activator [Rhinophrynus dorsalis]